LNNPLSQLTYRYGAIGKVELEFNSPKDGYFFSTNEAIEPRASLDIIYFSKGSTTYGVSQCIGGNCAGRGIQLHVFQNKKRVLLLNSDEFEINLSVDEIKGQVVKEGKTDLEFAN
jgi:hypothetical protein